MKKKLYDALVAKLKFPMSPWPSSIPEVSPFVKWSTRCQLQEGLYRFQDEKLQILVSEHRGKKKQDRKNLITLNEDVSEAQMKKDVDYVIVDAKDSPPDIWNTVVREDQVEDLLKELHSFNWVSRRRQTGGGGQIASTLGHIHPKRKSPH